VFNNVTLQYMSDMIAYYINYISLNYQQCFCGMVIYRSWDIISQLDVWHIHLYLHSEFWRNKRWRWKFAALIQGFLALNIIVMACIHGIGKFAWYKIDIEHRCRYFAMQHLDMLHDKNTYQKWELAVGRFIHSLPNAVFF